jgi:hypothetical protein
MEPNEPLSWLTLERYVLGELSAAEKLAVERRLAVSAQDRACLETIRSDMTTLPALPVVKLRPKKRSYVPAWSMGLAAAAALLFIFLSPDQSKRDQTELPNRSKGGEVAIIIASEERGRDVHSFGPGERLKVLVTCPATFQAAMRVLVFQDKQRFEPLPPTPPKCGNLVAWPSAFELDGTGVADVCVTWSSEAIQARSAQELGAAATCVRLAPR